MISKYRITNGEYARKEGELVGIKNTTDSQKYFIIEIEDKITVMVPEEDTCMIL
jgi:hypothetical protein